MAHAFTPQAAVTVQGTIEQLNRGGVKIEGSWYNYPRDYSGERIPREAVGAFVVLAVLLGEGKPMIGSVLKLEKAAPASASAAPAPSEPKPAPSPAPSPTPAPAVSPEGPSWTDHPATDGQKKKIEDLSQALGLSAQMVNLVVKLRFQNEAKSVESLTKGEASRLIHFLDSDPATLLGKGRKG